MNDYCKERISLAGIARVLQLSEDCVQRYVNRKAQQVSQQVEVTPGPKKQHLTVQMDELWSFVDDKGSEQWVWLALDAATREVVGLHIGDRSGNSAQALWQSLPPIYRQCAVIYTLPMECLSNGVTEQAASPCRQGQWVHELPNRASIARYGNAYLGSCVRVCHSLKN